MAEMTASEAVQTTIHVLDLSFAQRQQISALIERQAAEIAKLNREISELRRGEGINGR